MCSTDPVIQEGCGIFSYKTSDYIFFSATRKSHMNRPTCWNWMKFTSALTAYNKRLIRPVVTYGCEAWTLTDRNEQYLGIFECRILRKIFGPVQNKMDPGETEWIMNWTNRKRRHGEIYKKKKNSLVRSRGADGWQENTKRILEWKPIGTRIRGRPRKRWIVDIEEYM